MHRDPAPRATNALAIVTALAFLATMFAGPHIFMQAGFVPARFTQVLPLPAVPLALTPLSATLLHAGWLHLGFNLLMLVYCGRGVEGVVGWARLLALYVLGAYGAALGQYLVDPVSASPMVGASGAISAVVAAYALMFGRDVSRIGPIPGLVVRALWLAAAWVAIQWLVGTASGGGSTIATAAHVGGFVAGLAAVTPLMLRQVRAIKRPR